MQHGQNSTQHAAQIWGRITLSFAIAAVLALLLAQRLAGVDAAQVVDGLARVAPGAWGLALLATGTSFWALGRYDAVIHRHLGTGCHGPKVHRAGFAAIAISQTLGLGLITGALVRWRLLPGLSLWQATKINGTVTLSFLAGWAVVTATVLTVIPAAPFKGFAIGCLGLACAGLVLLAGPWRMARLRQVVPKGGTMARLLVLTAIDTGMAGLALWALMPMDIAFLLLLPAFLLAYGAGMISGSPGGVGAFELTLLALLPPGQDAGVLAAVLAFRVVYYALPAVIGGIVLARGTGVRPAYATPDLSQSFAEAQLLRQGQLQALAIPQGHLLTGRTAHGLVALRQPMGDVLPAMALKALIQSARAERLTPVLYKCSARMAVTARSTGFAVRLVGQEGWLDPATFTLATPARAALRRKLRKAASAGVIACESRALPMAELAAQNLRWIATHGAEHGFSMGRFQPDYIEGQRVIIAWSKGRMVGFATFHATPTEWALDLLRPDPAAPDGTAHALIIAAVQAAAAEGVARLSLAAAPIHCFTKAPALPVGLAPLARHLSAYGLAQFKQSFAPHWQPLYLCAVSWPALGIAAVELMHAVRRPAALALPEPSPEPAEYEIATAQQSWHRIRQHAR